MRFPKESQLTEEQRNVYFYAPIDKNVLVSGPPGTGKTIIACLRALELQKRGCKFQLLVFNRVLKQFTRQTYDGHDVPTESFYAWFFRWWRSSGLPPHPTGGAITICCDFEDKDQVKSLGARWDPKSWRSDKKRPGAWLVEFDTWASKRDNLLKWRIEQHPPKPADGKGLVDWKEALTHVLGNFAGLDASSFVFGTFIIDEGQDFPPEAFRLLEVIGSGTVRKSGDKNAPQCIFVLADENQRLTSSNSTLANIVESLSLPPERQFKLHDNFRNTREIALLARSFYADVGHLPKVPERAGEKPVHVLTSKREGALEFVARWVKNNAKREAAVLCFRDDTRKWFAESLVGRIAMISRPDLKLQTYSSKEKTELEFDRADTLTILNLQSCKGLEFDCVFVADLAEGKATAGNDDVFKMQMFVAVSRARENVYLLETEVESGESHFDALLPDKDVLTRASGNIIEPLQTSQRGVKTPTGKSNLAIERAEVSGGDWLAVANAIATRRSLRTADKRASGGCFWIYGNRELKSELETLGFRYSEKRSGWWKT